MLVEVSYVVLVCGQHKQAGNPGFRFPGEFRPFGYYLVGRGHQPDWFGCYFHR